MCHKRLLTYIYWWCRVYCKQLHPCIVDQQYCLALQKGDGNIFYTIYLEAPHPKWILDINYIFEAYVCSARYMKIILRIAFFMGTLPKSYYLTAGKYVLLFDMKQTSEHTIHILRSNLSVKYVIFCIVMGIIWLSTKKYLSEINEYL